jgi:hypothetical protein
VFFHVRFGSKADIQQRLTNVRFTPKGGHGFVVPHRARRERSELKLQQNLKGLSVC